MYALTYIDDTRYDRDWTSPPSNCAAEELVLTECLARPHLVATPGLTSTDFLFPEFRAIWLAMRHVWDADPTPTCFYERVHDALEASQCDGIHDELWYAAMRSERAHGLDIDHPLSGWWACRANKLLALLPAGGGPLADEVFALAVRRVQRATAARRIAHEAQTLFERAWCGDVEAATETAAQIVTLGQPQPVPVWQRDAL